MSGASATAVVERLIAGWEARDVDAIAACLSEDAVWHDMPHTPITGRGAICAVIGRFLHGMAAVEFEVLHAGAIDHGTVMNERVDRFTRADGTQLVIPVAGVFEVRDGLVTAWRDYFDATRSSG